MKILLCLGDEEGDACANNTGGSASLCYREPGFDFEPLPETEDVTRLNWLGEQILRASPLWLCNRAADSPSLGARRYPDATVGPEQ